MILQALTAYYEALAKKDGIASPGWGAVQVAFALELDGEGRLTRAIPLSSPTADGKKLKP